MEETINESSQNQQIVSMLKERRYERAIELIQQKQSNQQLMTLCLNTYRSLQTLGEEDYENWIYIFALLLTDNNFTAQFMDQYSGIINCFIAMGSIKFSLLIIKSMVHRLSKNLFGKFILLSYFHLFYSLVCDPTIGDLIQIYKTFAKTYSQLKQTNGPLPNEPSINLSQLYVRSLIRFLGNIINYPIQINTKYTQQAANICTLVLEDMARELKEDTNINEIQQMGYKAYFNKIPLSLISKLKINILRKPSIIFTNSFLQEYNQGMNQFASKFHTKEWIIALLIRTVNNELQVDLSAPSNFSTIQDQFLRRAIQYICQYFQHKNQSNVEFVAVNYTQVAELIQKMHIFIGSINPKDQLHKHVLKVFSKPQFLTVQATQKLYSRLINKHSNYSFKIHLITQYRHLLTPSCSRTVWIRSTALLLKQLKMLEPNTGIDYIGHIISVAFFWKHLLKKFCQSQKFIKECYLNITQVKLQFEQSLKKLRQGLQMKIQVAHSEKSEIQRNETSLCIFRISQLISA